MPAPSLRQLCTATAIRSVKYLNDIGNIPYALARPFLLKIESPEKLRSLELQSPHIMKDDAELWLEFIKRDIPRWDEYALPEQPDCWYDVYCDLREQVQRAVDEDAEKLKMALDGISSERAKHSAKFVTDRRTIRLPQERPTMKQRYASYDRKMGGIAPVFTAPKSGLGSADPLGSPLWSFERPPLPRSSETKKKNNIFTATRRNPVLAVPTKQLNNRATQIKQAPRSLIEEHRRIPEPAITRRRETPTLRAPGRSSSQSSSNTRSQSGPATRASLRQREARLRAITSGQASTSPSPSRASPRIRSPAGSDLRGASSPSARPSPGSLPAKPTSHSRTPVVPDSKGSKSQSGANTDLDESQLSPPPARRVKTIRKRPPPSVFIQPKKKKKVK